MNELATKHNQGKPKLSLVPFTFVQWSHGGEDVLAWLSRAAHSVSPQEYELYISRAIQELANEKDMMYGLAEVMEFGALKYERNNWKGGFVWSEMIDAGMRHAYQCPEKDIESGLHHWKHLAFCLAMLQYMYENKTGVNDLEWTNTQNNSEVTVSLT